MFSLLQRGFSNSFRIAKHCNYLNNGIYTTVIYHKPPADEGNKSKVAVVSRLANSRHTHRPQRTLNITIHASSTNNHDTGLKISFILQPANKETCS